MISHSMCSVKYLILFNYLKNQDLWRMAQGEVYFLGSQCPKHETIFKEKHLLIL